MATHQIRCSLAEPKKSCGKYVVDGTQNQAYPTYLYLQNHWLNSKGGKDLPISVVVTFDTQGS